MKQITKYIGMFAALSLVMIALAPNYIGEADAYQQSGVLEETKETFFFRGQLTQATENNPYGGETLGDYFVQVNVNEVKVIANLDSPQSDGKVLEAWLVDFGGKPAIYLGTFKDNELNVSFQINEWIYEALVISKVSENSNSFENPIGGAALEKAPKHKSSKSF
jgi:hypothetical protein